MKKRYCILFLLAGLTSGLLRADDLTYTVGKDIGAGQTRYQFTLTNTGDTGGTLFDLFLELPLEITNINTASIGAPAGWGDPAGGLLFFGPDVNPATSFIEWTADFSGAHDVAIGSSLAGFSVTTLQPIDGPILFALNDSTSFGTAVQAPVPEPGSFILLLTVAVALGVRVRHYKLRKLKPPSTLSIWPVE